MHVKCWAVHIKSAEKQFSCLLLLVLRNLAGLQFKNAFPTTLHEPSHFRVYCRYTVDERVNITLTGVSISKRRPVLDRKIYSIKLGLKSVYTICPFVV